MTEENAKFDAQWLSAYVDGELAGEALAQAEQRLAEDPQARQTVLELRALSQQLRSMPREVVGEDLGPTILQRAERTMLLGDLPTPAVSQPAGLRRWGWAALALAASGLLVLLLPSDPLEQKPLASAQRAADQSPPEAEMFEAEMSEPALSKALALPERQVPEPEVPEEGVSDAVRSQAEAPDSEALLEEKSSRRPAAGAGLERAIPSSAVPAMAAKVLGAKQLAKKTLLAPPPAVPPPAGADSPQPSFAGRAPLEVLLRMRADRLAHFEALLARHGIRVEEAPGSGSLESAARAAQASDANPAARAALDAEEQVVWVEASLEQIQRVLASCQQDVANWESVQVAAGPEEPSLAPLRQYQRSGPLAAAERAQEPETEPTKPTFPGRAQRLSPGQRTAPSARQEAAVQVLFILQQSTRPAAEPAGR
jgi:hypothetical protein